MGKDSTRAVGCRKHGTLTEALRLLNREETNGAKSGGEDSASDVGVQACHAAMFFPPAFGPPVVPETLKIHGSLVRAALQELLSKGLLNCGFQSPSSSDFHQKHEGWKCLHC